MKKLSIMAMTGLLVTSTTGNTVLATTYDGSDRATSEAAVQILPGTGVIDPEVPNPIDPEEPSIPIDPINPNPGSLRINHVSDLNFGDFTLTGRKEMLHAKKVTTTTGQDLPAFINIADLRGTGDGWTLKVSQSGELVRGGVLTFDPEYNGADQGIESVGGELAADGDEIDVLIAEKNAGMGSHSALLGGIDGVSLTIPKDATVGQQKASLNWNIVADPTAEIPEEIVEIPDNNLRAALKEELGVTDDNQITKAKMETMTEFTAVGKGIEELTGMEYASNLKTLKLDNNKITNESIAPVIRLAKLETVDLGGNQIMNSQILSNWASSSYASSLTRINAHNQNLGRRLSAVNSTDVALLGLRRIDGNALQMKNLIGDSSGNYSSLDAVMVVGSNVELDFQFIEAPIFQVNDVPSGTRSLKYQALWESPKVGFSAYVEVNGLDLQIEP
ncbi:hypothetical protein HB848_04280 [Listeria rocourtiae]|uniref:WxL domain-containing protein n=1 Tax=Listeria rocourtiae TaxID=647910 RepID=UPI00162407E9|nr:WxL domain-containing protein [Listeria rocourtiae]MBC1434549.1 hypothetical protein [Listeria rocourtiae]